MYYCFIRLVVFRCLRLRERTELPLVNCLSRLSGISEGLWALYGRGPPSPILRARYLARYVCRQTFVATRALLVQTNGAGTEAGHGHYNVPLFYRTHSVCKSWDKRIRYLALGSWFEGYSL